MLMQKYNQCKKQDVHLRNRIKNCRWNYKKQGEDEGNLMIKIEKVELSPNPVVVNGKVKISVTIVTHNYLNKNYTHKQLATYTHKQLKDRGTTW